MKWTIPSICYLLDDDFFKCHVRWGAMFIHLTWTIQNFQRNRLTLSNMFCYIQLMEFLALGMTFHILNLSHFVSFLSIINIAPMICWLDLMLLLSILNSLFLILSSYKVYYLGWKITRPGDGLKFFSLARQILKTPGTPMCYLISVVVGVILMEYSST